ncbi:MULTISPECIES: DUF1906 domain-containing protein [unclassified Streptomyces]|uniref:DUF1906 domain-containing protein n=1 Tax=unclassified Streptomyces TaxID=2593676 RepID=UPI00068E3C52|nr:DUF1906 domain-containing protein [Streptomyces sp. NRRL F-2747]
MAPIRTLLSGLLGAALLIPVHPSTAADDGRIVEYRGMRVTVPGDWRVVDLERSPDACLRLDLPTLYLGPAGTQGRCTGRAVQRRADTLHLEPLEGAPARADIPTLTVDGAGAIPEAEGDSHEVRYALRGSGVMATVSYGGASEAVRDMLARAGGRAAGRGASADSASAAAGPKPVRAQQPLTGAGFDTCTAPTQDAMDGWRSGSPFGAVGIYIGGRARACAQPRLTAGWVRRQAEAGWHLMPLWVGPQPWNNPATGLSTDPSRANQEGIEAAEGAVRAARSLGLAEGTVLYNDLENYTDRTTWDPPAVAYLTAWTVRLHELGYRAGAYVAASSGAKALNDHHDQAPEAMPDVLWVASWNGRASVADADTGLPAGTHRWAGRRRAHQYRGDHDATYAGVTLTIDRSWIDVNPPLLGAARGTSL